jgi:hypothetical protein
MQQAYESVKLESPAASMSNFNASALSPGGWLECADVDMIFYTHHGLLTDDSALSLWSKDLIAGIRAIGMEPLPASNLQRWMREAGFVNLSHTNLPLPLGPWPKDKKLVG